MLIDFSFIFISDSWRGNRRNTSPIWNEFFFESFRYFMRDEFLRGRLSDASQFTWMHWKKVFPNIYVNFSRQIHSTMLKRKCQCNLPADLLIALLGSNGKTWDSSAKGLHAHTASMRFLSSSNWDIWKWFLHEAVNLNLFYFHSNIYIHILAL